MTLGIVDRLWELLEGDCTKLDLLLAQHTTVGHQGDTYGEYVLALQKREHLRSSLGAVEERITALDQLVTYLSLVTPNASVNGQIKIVRDASSKQLLEIAALVSEFTLLKFVLKFPCTDQRDRSY
jgi:hypothetical protein